VRELNADLVALGYATSSELDPTSDYFGSETTYALERLQDALGENETGSLALGQAVFLPAPVRIASVAATLGAGATPGGPVAQATSIRRQVQVNLDASQQSSVRVGDRAQVTLPDNQVTSGVVSRIGTVASSSGSNSSGSGSSGATIPIYITLRHPRDAGRLDQAPVQVTIVTAGVQNALIVPVNALLAQAGGSYAVETVDNRGVHQLVPVTVGMFDDADGLVQVSGNLSVGDQVVVPAT
jgi:multidrug efflux pump subunit AcrA (membrane-fusion protein)